MKHSTALNTESTLTLTILLQWRVIQAFTEARVIGENPLKHWENKDNPDLTKRKKYIVQLDLYQKRCVLYRRTIVLI